MGFQAIETFSSTLTLYLEHPQHLLKRRPERLKILLRSNKHQITQRSIITRHRHQPVVLHPATSRSSLVLKFDTPRIALIHPNLIDSGNRLQPAVSLPHRSNRLPRGSSQIGRLLRLKIIDDHSINHCVAVKSLCCRRWP